MWVAEWHWPVVVKYTLEKYIFFLSKTALEKYNLEKKTLEKYALENTVWNNQEASYMRLPSRRKIYFGETSLEKYTLEKYVLEKYSLQ